MEKLNKLIYNGTWRNNGICLGIHWEWWNKDSRYKELRVFILSWEFNFNILNKKKHKNKTRS